MGSWQADNLGWKPRFPLLVRLVTSLLTISVSNDDSKRGFSIFRKIHTDQRPNLSQGTLIALMAINLNSLQCCYEATFTKELLTECKKVTSKVVKI